jgi:hypothetical protein
MVALRAGGANVTKAGHWRAPMIVAVNLGGPAYLYANATPPEMTIIGTVTRKSGEVGALVRYPSGAFAQLNGMVLQPLDRREVICAIAEACIGRISQPAAAGSARAESNAILPTVGKRLRLVPGRR